MNGLQVCIAQVDHQCVFLVFFPIVNPSAVRFLNGISAKVPNQDVLQLFQCFRLAFEELVQQILLPVLEWTALHVTIEYSEEEKTATVCIAYGGRRFDPAEEKNDLAYTVLKQSVHELSYRYTEGAELSNTIRAVILP